MQANFKKILDEYQDLTEQLSSGEVIDLAKLGKRQADLLPLVSKIEQLQQLEGQIAGNNEILETADLQLKALAIEENDTLQQQVKFLIDTIETDLLPQDPNDDKNIIMEMRAGAGGDEATLFVAELFRAYAKFAEKINGVLL